MKNNASKIRNSFLLYIFFIVIGFVSLLIGYKEIAFILIMLGIIIGVVSAFMSCPYCKKLNGVFFKTIVGGVFPIGRCHHCGKSYFKNANEE